MNLYDLRSIKGFFYILYKEEYCMRLLIIEDEKHLAEAMKELLKKENYVVDVFNDGREGLDNALTGIYDLILLDIMLPSIDGLEILRTIRSEGIQTPVLLLTARNQVNDRVKGLDLGADDYLSKPFAQEELHARIRALLRRKGEVSATSELKYHDIILDYNTLVLSCHSNTIMLTVKESEMLQFLMTRKNMITPKELLIEKLWGFNTDAEDNNVEVYISFLRKKLKFLKCETSIKTTRGLGYSLEVNHV